MTLPSPDSGSGDAGGRVGPADDPSCGGPGSGDAGGRVGPADDPSCG